MPDGPGRDRRERILSETNERDAPALRRLTDRLAQQPELGQAIGRFRAGLNLGPPGEPYADGLMPAGFELDASAAKAFVGVLSVHPAFSEHRRLGINLAILGLSDADPNIASVRRDAADVLVTGALAFGVLGLSETLIEPLMQVALGAETFSTVVRRTLLGFQPVGEDGWPPIPDWLGDFDDPGRRFGCVAGIQDALTGFMLAVRGSQSTSYATGITALSPKVGCDGTLVRIQGSGFGATQPPDVSVLFPHAAGKCVKADVVSWSDTEVQARAPAGVGTGCVGFVRQVTLGAGAGEFAAASEQLAGELEGCLGMAASNVAQALRTASPVGVISCPPCLPGLVNRFSGGGPGIGAFTANGGTDITVEPDTLVILRWQTVGATSVSLTRSSGSGPLFPVTGQLPVNGSHVAGFFAGSRPSTTTYRLTVTNACGSVSRTVTVRLQKEPKLAISAIEVVQVIQRSGNSVRLVSRKRTVVRVFVNSGLTGGFDYGSGPNIVPGVSGRVTAFPATAGFGSDGTPLSPGSVNALPVGTHSRAVATHSLNVELPIAACTGQVRIDVRLAAPGHEQDLGGSFVAVGSTTVTFIDKPNQNVEPMLVVDTINGLGPPTIAQYNASLQQARTMFPIADAGFVLAAPITLATGTGRNLTTLGAWSSLLNEVQTMAFVHGGAIRTAVVPRDPGTLMFAGSPARYSLNGIGSPRIGALMPGLVAQVGVPGTFAHEMGHSCGLRHAPCCTNFWDLQDSRLPGGTEDVGFDVPLNVLIPAGRGELMSYCGDLSRCPGSARWPSIATWDILFDTLPI